jgi:hypothetical protein
MKLKPNFALFGLLIVLFGCKTENEQKTNSKSNKYADLVALFKEWRTFENPPLREGVPDYTADMFKKRLPDFKKLEARLMAFDTAAWSVDQKVDWHIVRAEMNGFDFYNRILQPWVRDPAFYKTIYTERSDVPDHEGPTHHARIELWQYSYPLSIEAKKTLLSQLKVIVPLNQQAQKNLTGNAKDLWIAGIRDIKGQIVDLQQLMAQPDVKTDAELTATIQTAIASTQDLATWLEKESVNKTGVSGIGKDNYTWYQQNVNLSPMTWDDEVMLLKRELTRAWSSLKLEEHRNRKLPELKDADSPQAYDALAKKAAQSLLSFLEKQDILTVKPYFAEALQPHLGSFIPKEKRNFFRIGQHYDPRPLFSHFYHWFELAIMDKEPHRNEIRRAPLLYNTFVSHNEGIATAVEEMFMQAGLYDDAPRTKEIVYIMIAQRAARGLGSLYAHANTMTMAEAGGIHTEYTPRGWMKTEKDLMMFEQHLYLRQPGYGTSYITGKYLAENAMAELARMKELKKEPFVLKDYFDKLMDMGDIPAALGTWEMTGSKGLMH